MQNQQYALPCINYIACGSCPYSNRCQYIHDSRISNHTYKPLKKCKINVYGKDLFYWPRSNYYCNNYYDFNNNDKYVHSIWINFVYTFDENGNNLKENTTRLPFFVNLSNKKIV